MWRLQLYTTGIKLITCDRKPFFGHSLQNKSFIADFIFGRLSFKSSRLLYRHTAQDPAS